MTVLVTYATAHGSTRGVAERIAERLELSGLPVDLLALADVDDVDDYEAAVIGSPIHDGSWLPEAAAFVRDRSAGLARRPVWLFSVGVMGDGSSAVWPPVAALFRRLSAQRGTSFETPSTAALHDLVHARGHRAFAGAIEPAHWPLVGQIAFRLMGGRFGDHRDWTDIEAWADGVAAAIRTLEHTPEIRHLRVA